MTDSFESLEKNHANDSAAEILPSTSLCHHPEVNKIFRSQKVHFLWLSTFIFFTTCATTVILSIIYPDLKPPPSGTTFSTCYEQQTTITDEIDGEVDLFNSNTTSNISTNIGKSIGGSHDTPTPVLNPVLPEISQERDDLGLFEEEVTSENKNFPIFNKIFKLYLKLTKPLPSKDIKMIFSMEQSKKDRNIIICLSIGIFLVHACIIIILSV